MVSVLPVPVGSTTVAGSKLLRRDDPERLISVGMATDVFDVPYLGLDVDEIAKLVWAEDYHEDTGREVGGRRARRGEE